MLRQLTPGKHVPFDKHGPGELCEKLPTLNFVTAVPSPSTAEAGLQVGESETMLPEICPEICPEMHVNEIHLPHNRHPKVSSLTKFHQNTQNYIKYEVCENV